MRMHLLTKLANVAHAKGDGRLQRAGEGCIVGPVDVGRERSVLAAIGDGDIARVADVTKRVKSDPIGATITRGLAERHRLLDAVGKDVLPKLSEELLLDAFDRWLAELGGCFKAGNILGLSQECPDALTQFGLI